MMKRYLILSPFAANGTQNSGDDLIVKSLIYLLEALTKKIIRYDVISIAKSTKNKEKQLNEILIDKYSALICPGFRISIEGQETLNVRLKYIEKAIQNKIPIFLIGSSWCIFPGIEGQTKLKINPYEKALLKYILNDKNSLITARDNYTQLLLKNNEIDCEMTGDLGLFDVNQLNKDFKYNKIINMAISMPHNIYYYKYCMALKNKLEKKYGWKIYLCTHQFLQGNKSYRNLYGGAENLNFYKSCDFHIGFRLHGQIWFLRNRKPSFLICEDGRSYGHLNTFRDLGIHATPNYILEKAKNIKNESNLLLNLSENSLIDINNIIYMIDKEIENEFIISKLVLNKIDELWKDKMENIIFKILEV